jgi:hypothetical protein
MSRLCLAAERRDAEQVSCLWLDESPLALKDERDATTAILPLSPDLIQAVFARYAKPLATEVPPAIPGDAQIRFTTSSGARATVRAFAFRGYGDVLPSDYLLLETHDQEPVCASTSILSAALLALARAATRARAAAPSGS